jgi:hypothetical protein
MEVPYELNVGHKPRIFPPPDYIPSALYTQKLSKKVSAHLKQNKKLPPIKKHIMYTSVLN